MKVEHCTETCSIIIIIIITGTEMDCIRYISLVPRRLPDFVSQLWRKIRRRPGIIATSWTGNGGLS